jgi:hypothetical protein
MNKALFGTTATLLMCLSLTLISCGGGSDTHGACESSTKMSCGNDFTESECSIVNGIFHANASCCDVGYCSSNSSASRLLVNETALTSFSLNSPAVTGTIDASAKTISVAVPKETNVTALVATFTTTGSTVSVGSTVQVSGTTVNDFTNPVTYTVTDAKGTATTYIVTVTPKDY